MKTLFQKLFGPEERASHPSGDGAVRFTLHRLHEHSRRSLIGWIAGRMAQILGKDNSFIEALIYTAYHTECIEQKDAGMEDSLIYLASRLLDWIEHGEEVLLRLREMQLSDSYEACMFQVYEEIREEIKLYFPHKQDKNSENYENNNDENDEVWQVYRDVIHAATQQKLLLIKEGEVHTFKKGDLICEASIRERPDIPKARDLAKLRLQEMDLPPSTIMSYLLVISEAITNILKHALEGKLSIFKTETSLHIVVEDRGPGFSMKQLPYMTLTSGYSTKKSLGQGFTLMMKMTDKILLSTTPNGSVIILIYDMKEGVTHEGTH